MPLLLPLKAKLFLLYLQVVVDPIGVSIWQMAAHPFSRQQFSPKPVLTTGNELATDRTIGDGDVTSDSEVEADSFELYEEPITENLSIAIACDDGCVRIYNISDSDGFTYHKSLPRVSGEISASCSAHYFCDSLSKLFKLFDYI